MHVISFSRILSFTGIQAELNVAVKGNRYALELLTNNLSQMISGFIANSESIASTLKHD